MTPFSFLLLLIAMVAVVSIGIRIALLSGRTTWWQQQTPLSPLAFTGRGRAKSEESDEEMALDEKRMSLGVGRREREGAWRVR